MEGGRKRKRKEVNPAPLQEKEIQIQEEVDNDSSITKKFKVEEAPFPLLDLPHLVLIHIIEYRA